MLRRDLGHLAGRTLTFTISCDWDVPQERSSGIPPLVYCGSPMLTFQDFARPDPGYNLILVSIDTLRSDHLGCYGYPRPVSPHLDRYAEENMRCANMYSQAPYTLPSHASLFTSLYPSSHGVQSSEHRLSRNTDLLAEILAGQGLATAAFTGGGLVSHRFGFNRGFDIYCEVDPLGDRFFEGLAPTANRLGDGSAGSFSMALDWIRAERDRPFFLFLHTFMVHDFLPPAEWVELFNAGCQSKLRPGLEAKEAKNEALLENSALSETDLTYFINMYDATIRATDQMMGELFAHLQELGLEKRTVVVITSDHGEEFKEHGQFGHTRSVYEELIRIPLIMKVPGVAGGHVIDTALNQVDIVPTLLEIMGFVHSGTIQGRSFVGLFSGEDEQDRPVYAEVDVKKLSRRACLIMDGWKYIEGSTEEVLSCPAPADVQLFRLNDDPCEKSDLSKGQAAVRQDLKKVMQRFRQDLGHTRQALGVDETSSELSPELLEVLRQQGYL